MANGGWVMRSQSRQVTFSRTVWITFHWRGMTSSVSVTSSPSFASFSDPQQLQVFGASITTRSRGRCSGNGLRTGLRCSTAATFVFAFAAAASASASSSEAVVSLAIGLEPMAPRRLALELQLELVEQALPALGTLAVERAPELLDPEAQMRDQRLASRKHGLGMRRLGLHGIGPRLGCREGCAQGVDLGSGVCHATKFTAWSQGL
jgi:hypothetical protein